MAAAPSVGAVRSALDSTVLVDVLHGDFAARASVTQAVAEGVALACGAVYAELVSGERAPEVVRAILHQLGVELDPSTDLALWTLAGERHAQYLARRRAAKVPDDRRLLLADFIIGAHAVVRADCLVTADAGIYATYFPDLTLRRY